MKTKTILAENLKTYRRVNNLSQEMMAIRAKISIRGYGKIERGEVAVTLDTLEKISCGLGIPVELLLSERMYESLSACQHAMIG